MGVLWNRLDRADQAKDAAILSIGGISSVRPRFL